MIDATLSPLAALVKDVRSADKDLKGLKEAVEMIEKNRAKFPQISEVELNSRRKFIDDSQNAITAVKNGINSKEVLRKIEDDERRSRGGAPREHYDEKSALSSQLYEENSQFIKNQKQQTIQMINRQDESLGILGDAVDRVGVMAKEINTEVKEQNILLDGLDRDISDASSRLDVVQEALGKLLKTKDGCQIWTVVILTLILVLLSKFHRPNDLLQSCCCRLFFLWFSLFYCFSNFIADFCVPSVQLHWLYGPELPAAPSDCWQ